jgi:hypothetical protein
MLGAQLTPVIFFWDMDVRPSPKSVHEDMVRRIVFDGMLGGSRFVITLGGYVASEKKDRNEAAYDMNSFFLSITLLRGYPLDPLGDNDLDVCEVDSQTNKIQVRQATLSRLGSAFTLFPEFLVTVVSEWPSLPVTDSAILPEAVRLSEQISRSDYKVAFSQVLRANSARNDGEWITAFVSSWIVVEMLVSAELRRFLARGGTPDVVISESLRAWTIHTKVRLLKKWNVLQPLAPGDPTVPTDAELQEIRKLSTVRNRVIHAGIRPDPTEVERVFKLAWRAMWRFLRLSGIVYKPYVDATNAIQQAFVAKHNIP